MGASFAFDWWRKKGAKTQPPFISGLPGPKRLSSGHRSRRVTPDPSLSRRMVPFPSKSRRLTGKVPADNSGKETAMAVGTVKFFNVNKGFGFIAPEGGGKDVFVHISAVERAGMRGLADGQKIAFDLEKDRQGRESATNLRSA
jgi:CspA family cold shock protein